VIQAAALMMRVFGFLSKFGALFITIPEPIIGGIFCVLFGMIAAKLVWQNYNFSTSTRQEICSSPAPPSFSL
jgi:xanthine/uracil permease